MFFMQLALNLINSRSLGVFQDFYAKNKMPLKTEFHRVTPKERIDFITALLPFAPHEIIIDIHLKLYSTIYTDAQQTNTCVTDNGYLFYELYSAIYTDLKQINPGVANNSDLLSGQAAFFELLINTVLGYTWGAKLAFELKTNFMNGDTSFIYASSRCPILQIYYLYFTVIFDHTNQNVKYKVMEVLQMKFDYKFLLQDTINDEMNKYVGHMCFVELLKTYQVAPLTGPNIPGVEQVPDSDSACTPIEDACLRQFLVNCNNLFTESEQPALYSYGLENFSIKNTPVLDRLPPDVIKRISPP